MQESKDRRLRISDSHVSNRKYGIETMNNTRKSHKTIMRFVFTSVFNHTLWYYGWSMPGSRVDVSAVTFYLWDGSQNFKWFYESLCSKFNRIRFPICSHFSERIHRINWEMLILKPHPKSLGQWRRISWTCTTRYFMQRMGAIVSVQYSQTMWAFGHRIQIRIDLFWIQMFWRKFIAHSKSPGDGCQGVVAPTIPTASPANSCSGNRLETPYLGFLWSNLDQFVIAIRSQLGIRTEHKKVGSLSPSCHCRRMSNSCADLRHSPRVKRTWSVFSCRIWFEELFGYFRQVVTQGKQGVTD